MRIRWTVPAADDLENIKNVIVYALKADAVEILHVYHGAQDWR